MATAPTTTDGATRPTDRRRARRRRAVARLRLRPARAARAARRARASSGSAVSPTTRTHVARAWRPHPARILVSYTCDVRPSTGRSNGHPGLGRGRRSLVALHGTSSASIRRRTDGWRRTHDVPLWIDTLGSQFIAHPPIAPVPRRQRRTRPLARRRASSRSRPTDELYLNEYPDRTALVPAAADDVSGRRTGLRRRRLERHRPRPPRDVPAPARAPAACSTTPSATAAGTTTWCR